MRRSTFQLLPGPPKLAARWRRSSLWLLGGVSVLHLQFLALVPGLGAKSGALLALYDSGLGAGARGLNAEVVQYGSLFLLIAFSVLETWEAAADRGFAAEYWQATLDEGIARHGLTLFAFLAVSLVALLAVAFEGNIAAGETLYAAIASTATGCTVIATLVTLLWYTTVCRVSWALLGMTRVAI